jgi:succinate dehydrogenase / fumarate reductase, cytochrome b subunit
MMITGVITLIFIVLHVYMFKFGHKEGEAGEIRLFELVVKEFQNPLVVGWYVVAMITLGLHLSHGIASAFQSLGLRDSSGHPKLKGIGPALAWILAIGFASMPVWAFVFKPQSKSKPAIEIKLPAGPANMTGSANKE